MSPLMITILMTTLITDLAKRRADNSNIQYV
jgi:hypothetical protein